MKISIAELETVAAFGWRATEEERLGGWLLRAAEGFTGRANSALAVGDPGLPLEKAVDAVCGWYLDRGLPPMIAVPFPAGRPYESDLDRLLAEQGWGIRAGAAVVMTADLRTVAGLPVAAEVDIAAEPDESWLSVYHYRGQDLPPVARRLLMSAPWQAFGQVRIDGATGAVGRIAEHGGWAGLTAVEVHKDYRRRGLGTAITSALAAHAADRGAHSLYLQVENANAAARALYHQVGFTDHHGYHYRIAPGHTVS